MEKFHHVAVLDNIFLPFRTQPFSLLAHESASSNLSVEMTLGSSADEFVPEISVDRGTSVWRFVATLDRPRARFLSPVVKMK